MKRLDRETVRAKWLEFFESFGYVAEIQRVGDNFPEERSLRVLFGDVDHFDPDFALYVLEYPDQAIFDAGKAAVLDTLLPEQREKVEAYTSDLNIHITNLPENRYVDIALLHHDHVDRLISTTGIVKKIKNPEPFITEATFRCKKCGNLIKEPQSTLTETIKEPSKCYKEQRGCGKPLGMTAFDLVVRLSKVVDRQIIEVQSYGEKKEKTERKKIRAVLWDDLVDSVLVGDIIRINGILRIMPKKRGKEKMNRFDMLIDVLSVESENEQETKQGL